MHKVSDAAQLQVALIKQLVRELVKLDTFPLQPGLLCDQVL
eukprot:CAMPEP_0195046334 /NCGR_PEP_ID=MMETSP0347-20130606/23149_1 /TAXON_ID=2932 /ORGANISM="Alexandrium fundyense, Strain CCMP1719" /LENGTH=40 /DNA_ID= /DNA_START= /DNA_END= /DNA_ORIENTATION=